MKHLSQHFMRFASAPSRSLDDLFAAANTGPLPPTKPLKSIVVRFQCSLRLLDAFLAANSASSLSLAFFAARWAACIATNDPGALEALGEVETRERRRKERRKGRRKGANGRSVMMGHSHSFIVGTHVLFTLLHRRPTLLNFIVIYHWYCEL